MATDIREVAILIDGRQTLRMQTMLGDAEIAMEISRWMPLLKKHRRVCVVVTGSDLIRRIVCRSR